MTTEKFITGEESEYIARIEDVVRTVGSQGRLAQILEISPGTVSGWVKGSRPQPRTLTAIEEKLRIRGEWILHGTEPKMLGLVMPEEVDVYGGREGFDMGRQTSEQIDTLLAQFPAVDRARRQILVEQICNTVRTFADWCDTDTDETQNDKEEQ